MIEWLPIAEYKPEYSTKYVILVWWVFPEGPEPVLDARYSESEGWTLRREYENGEYEQQDGQPTYFALIQAPP